MLGNNRIQTWYKWLISLAVFLLLIGVSIVPAFAADYEYTQNVTLTTGVANPFSCNSGDTVYYKNNAHVKIESGSWEFNGCTIDLSENQWRAFRVEKGATLTLNNTTIINGANGTPNGAIAVDNGTLILNNCTFSNNGSANMNGGAINANNATIEINGGAFLNNTAKNGGAISFQGGSLTISPDNDGKIPLFQGNKATGQFGRGGAIGADPGGNGVDGNITINNAIFKETLIYSE